MPEEPLKKKKLKNSMLMDYCWLCLPRDELVEELGNLPAEIREPSPETRA